MGDVAKDHRLGEGLRSDRDGRPCGFRRADEHEPACCRGVETDAAVKADGVTRKFECRLQSGVGGLRTVDVHVLWLRQKLEEDPKHPRLILTVVGLGYKFAG